MMIFRWLILLVAAVVLPATAQAVTVQMEGAVATPGQFTLPAGSRLADALLVAQPDTSAYLLGGALLRESAKEAQLRLKAGLLFDLDALHARDGDRWLAVRDQLAALPVTGRIPAQFDARRLEIEPKRNLPLKEGDRIVLSQRPASVQVAGAVMSPCLVNYQPDALAAVFIAQCAAQPFASRDWAYVIQPDGAVHRVGMALWNRTDGLRVAPGATVLLAVDERVLGKDVASLNSEMAQLYATQIPGMAY